MLILLGENINTPTLVKASQRFIGGKLHVSYSITQKNTFGNDCFMLKCTFFTQMLTRLLVVWSVGTQGQYTGFRDDPWCRVVGGEGPQGFVVGRTARIGVTGAAAAIVPLWAN